MKTIDTYDQHGVEPPLMLLGKWVVLFHAAERHPWLVLRAMRRLVLRSVPPWSRSIAGGELLLDLACEPLRAADSLAPGEYDARLRAAAPAFAAAVKAWRQHNTVPATPVSKVHTPPKG